jgi:hypothetical protein
MFKQMLMRLFPKWFGPKCYRLAPSRYALLELFGHVALGPCWVTETERYGKKFCLACKLKPDGTTELPMLLGPGAIFRETELTKDEALDRARPEWTPYRKQDDEPVCDLCNEPERDCTCPEPEPVKEPETLPIPFDAIEAILDYHTPSLGSQIEPHIEKLRAWYGQEQDSIPF